MKHVAVIFNPQREPGYKYLLLVSPMPLSDERIRRFAAEIHRRSLRAIWSDASINLLSSVAGLVLVMRLTATPTNSRL